MKLDRELVRLILLEVETRPPTQYNGAPVEISGYDEDTIGYHLMLLGEAGFLVVEDVGYLGKELAFEASRLTYSGHEFLDTIRDDEVWRRTKEVAGKAGSVSLQGLLEIGKAVAKQQIAERFGLVL